MKRRNYNWLVFSTFGQVIAFFSTLMSALKGGHSESLPPAIILAVTIALSIKGWSKLEDREDARCSE